MFSTRTRQKKIACMAISFWIKVAFCVFLLSELQNLVHSFGEISKSRSTRAIPFLSNWWYSKDKDREFAGSNDVHVKEENSLALRNNEIDAQNRDSRFLSMFTVVKFDNTECLSSNRDNGTCFPASECYRRKGSAAGKCAKGYGVCCVFSKTCGQSTNQNCTYFTHNGFPGSFDGTGSCQMNVYKCSPDVCQLRLDFDSFNIAQPTKNGVCTNDQFIVSGTSTSVPITCGVNTGNHMYVDVGLDNTPITLSIVTSGPTYSRSWKIKITQVRCKDLARPPEGCLQYYRGVSGVIRSYNFDHTSGQQLSNQDYTSCIRVERNFCGIRYIPCNEGNANIFNPPDQQKSKSFSLTGTGTSGALVGAVSCNTDWITIPCATNTGKTRQLRDTICQDRICGDVFNSEEGMISSPVYSNVRPFRVHYHTDGNETLDDRNRGFCLNYVQQPCSTV